MVLSSDNSGMIVVKCTRLFYHLLISITGAQQPFVRTRKQWNQLSANLKDAPLRLKNVTWCCAQDLTKVGGTRLYIHGKLSYCQLMVCWRLREKDERNNRHNGHESVQEINTLVELLHWKWFVTKFLKNPVTVRLRLMICNLQFMFAKRSFQLKIELGE